MVLNENGGSESAAPIFHPGDADSDRHLFQTADRNPPHPENALKAALRL
jgi:hypothetical protein